jgi:hypothetical protein
MEALKLRAGILRVLTPEPRPTSDVPYHHDRAPGQKYLILDKTVISESTIYVALRRIDRVQKGQPRWLDPHAHHCNSFYIFIGDEDDLGGLHGEVEIGKHRFPVHAPSAVSIPPFAIHHYWLTSGSGWYLQITLSPTYEGSLADPADWRSELSPESSLRAYQPAEQTGRAWRLIDDALFYDAGIVVDAAEASLEFEPPTTGDPEQTLHIVVSRRGAPASVALDGSSTGRLSTPFAILSGERNLPLRDVWGRPLVVRVTQRPRRRSLERARHTSLGRDAAIGD